MSQRRFSTSTISGEEFVPWLASAGELAYTPYLPPEKDYYFQYSWIIPGIFSDRANRRRHYWFGCAHKDATEVRLLFAFWNRARQGDIQELFVSSGRARGNDVTAPLAAYRQPGIYASMPDSIVLIQHGSYLIVDLESQPYIDRGDLVLYRGIQNAKRFTVYRLANTHTWLRLMEVHAQSLKDSVISFNAVHCNVSRTETGSFKDRTFLLEELCRTSGLDPEPPISSLLYSGYALEEWCGVRKFGPNYVKFRTPLTNVRITTFVCNETEVKVIDPNKVEVIESVGCRVREVCV
jgi:hypothetical protein